MLEGTKTMAQEIVVGKYFSRPALLLWYIYRSPSVLCSNIATPLFLLCISTYLPQGEETRRQGREHLAIIGYDLKC